MSQANDASLQEYEFFWTGHSGKYVLLRTGTRHDDYLILDLETHTAQVIENDDISDAVHQRMLSAGVKVVEQVPWIQENSVRITNSTES